MLPRYRLTVTARAALTARGPEVCVDVLATKHKMLSTDGALPTPKESVFVAVANTASVTKRLSRRVYCFLVSLELRVLKPRQFSRPGWLEVPTTSL